MTGVSGPSLEELLRKMRGVARNGTWTPWGTVVCSECDYLALKDGPRAQHYEKHLRALEAMNRTAEVPCPEGHLRGRCDTCRCPCWVRADVALLQRIGFKSSELDWEGPFGWNLEQTGGMCAALVFGTADDREIVVTAMDGDIFVGEYAQVDDLDERWVDPIRTWQSGTLYKDDELLPPDDLDAMIEAAARKVIDLVRHPEVKS